MRKIRTKICGITTPEDALYAAQAGADALGLVFYPQSPRAIDIIKAQKITAALPPFVSVVALFVNESAQNIRRILAEVPIHLIQFHGDEDDAFCRQFDRPYIKAIRVQTASDIQNAAHRFPNAQALLFDAYHPSEYGGTGHCFDWTLLAEYSGKPWVLAGGLTPENVGEAVRITGAESVDVSGGVEASKGKKDAAKVAAFIREANRVSA
jgi:phosphoribosylanthranilate isomerase